MQGLSGLRTFVTGASGGIGRALVERLADEGCLVAATDLQAPDLPGVKVSIASDVTDPESVARAIQQAREALGGLDALVTAAGIQATKPTHELDSATFRKVLDVNVLGTFHAVSAVLPHMLERQAGRIVTFGSTAAVVAAPGLAAYAASKGAVLQLTRSIAAEYGRSGIRANCVCPGGTATAMLTAIESDRGEPDEFESRHPIGRFAQPDEIAAAVSYLLSDDASFVLGAAFMVDGGFTCV